jgi:pimeloyl-ACP methyl ester carboxylesterase
MSEFDDITLRYECLQNPARKLLSVITHQAYAGTLRSKPRGIATMPEVHEACGLDPDEMLPLLQSLVDAGFIAVDGDYPFEQLKLIGVPAEHRVAVNGADLVLWEWPGGGPPILFCHGTGLHSRCWDQVIAHLPGRHCFALDFRAHGRSSKTPPYFWRTFGQDASAVAESLSLAGALAVGHSMGGNAVTLAAAAHPAAFCALLLIDPVIRPQDKYVGPFKAAEFVARRRNQWSSPQEMFERFQDRPPFATWDRQVLRDYCEYGLVGNQDGFELACPPAIEAQIYENGALPEANIYPEIAAIQIPVHVVRARRPADPSDFMRGSPTTPDLASRFAHGTDLYLPEHSHFIPMEAPSLTAKLISGLIPG